MTVGTDFKMTELPDYSDPDLAQCTVPVKVPLGQAVCGGCHAPLGKPSSSQGSGSIECTWLCFSVSPGLSEHNLKRALGGKRDVSQL